MNYPLDAFVTINASDAEPGSLLRFRDMWALKLQRQEDGIREEMLILHGPNAGKVGQAPNAQGMTISNLYDWQIFVESLDGDPNSETWPAVSIGADEPVIHGHDWNNRLESQAATVSGVRVQVDGVQQYLPNFSVWLIAPDGRKLGDGPLFRVHSPARQPRV